jgi:class 3 adenylate cyclase
MSNQTNAYPKHALPAGLNQRDATVVIVDIVRMTSVVEKLPDEATVIAFLDGFYHLCSQHIEAGGGEVIKYMGDSCMALYEVADCLNAVADVQQIRREFTAYCLEFGLQNGDVRSAIHIGEVISGGFGPQGIKDVLGKAPGVVLSMSGSGISISEQVYRKLPSADRSPWRKRGGHVTYVKS